jgi:hypothetical protein
MGYRHICMEFQLNKFNQRILNLNQDSNGTPLQYLSLPHPFPKVLTLPSGLLRSQQLIWVYIMNLHLELPLEFGSEGLY